jgi:ribosome recycling factor
VPLHPFFTNEYIKRMDSAFADKEAELLEV